MTAYVFDANALLDFVEDGPGFHKVERLLLAAGKNEVALLISVMNLGEVFYYIWRKRTSKRVKRSTTFLTCRPNCSCGPSSGA